MDNVKRIEKETGLKIRDAEATVLKNGLQANRFKLEVGNKLLSYVAIEADESQILDEKILGFIQEYAEFENVLLISNYMSADLIDVLQKKKIGYLDRFNNLYLPFEFIVSGSEKKVQRSTSELNEFLVGYLFFQHNGFLQMTQDEIGKKINKSATTVNFLLKKMEQEEDVIKFGLNGYAIKNPRSFFDRWRHLLRKFQSKNLKGQYSGAEPTKRLIDTYLFRPDSLKEVSFGGPLVDELRDGYIVNANTVNVYTPVEYFSKVIEQLNLKPDSKGEIVIYESPMSLMDKDGFVHESLLCAELLNENHPRIREAGEERLEKFLKKLNGENYERYYEKNFRIP